MVNLFASLNAAAGALRSFQEGITVSQNNVNNVSTPGYVKQRANLQSLPFQLENGLIGGVRSGEIESSRSLTLEQTVRRHLSSLGDFAQQTSSLSQIEGILDISGESGIPAALNQLFSSFTAFSLSPDTAVTRQQVLDAANNVALAFNRAGHELSRISTQLDVQLQQTIEKINETAGRIQSFNESVLATSATDPGLEARAFADLEALSELADVNVLTEEDGTLTVLLGGEIPLVIGEQHQEIQLDFFVPGSPPNPGGRPSARVVDSTGRDVSGVVSEGQLKGLLDVRNEALPSIDGDATQDGSLNVLAKRLADRVNEILTNGLVSEGPPAEPGVALFAYDPANNSDVTRTLTVNPAISPDQLAAVSPGPPVVSNGVALELADLRNSRDPQNAINGMTLVEYYGSIAREAGDRLNTAEQGKTRADLLVTQSRDLREQTSGVSLDEEAVQLTQFQRTYEAAAQLVQVVDELIQTVLSLRR